LANCIPVSTETALYCASPTGLTIGHHMPLRMDTISFQFDKFNQSYTRLSGNESTCTCSLRYRTAKIITSEVLWTPPSGVLWLQIGGY